MRKLNKWIRYIIYLCLGFLGLILLFAVYLYNVAIVKPPIIKNENVLKIERTQIDTNCYTIGKNWIRKSKSGLWEMYVEGDAFERGVINGKLSKELIYIQEIAFNDKICKLIPSSFYRNFLKYFIGWFNRDLEKNLTEEQKLEIYGVSNSASAEFNYIGSPYQRMMNYHAAHDIGHALQNMALVGCSSFATWNEKSEDSTLIVGRNFDFFVDDKFAENKIIEFCAPTNGYKFMMVTWGGMTGVLSGMNMEGISVTINSAKSTIPKGAATPISLLSREILQYSKSIDDAISIARKRKTFVSESIFIGSAKDNKAIVIEKNPDTMDIYSTNINELICTNHYQGNSFINDEANKTQMHESASVYRNLRIHELLSTISKNTPQQTAALLRNQLGLKNKFIGYGNEKAVNQLICHHSIIFEPGKKLAWVSTSPWQLGEYICYDLNKIFSMNGLKKNVELCDSLKTIPADSFINSISLKNFLLFKKATQDLRNNRAIDLKYYVNLNPEYYHTFVVAGDYLFKKSEFKKAETYYSIALTKVIATKNEENYIRTRIEKCKSH